MVPRSGRKELRLDHRAPLIWQVSSMDWLQPDVGTSSRRSRALCMSAILYEGPALQVMGGQACLIQGCSSMAAAVGLMCGFFSRQARTKSFHSGECRVGKYILLLYMISVAVWTCTRYRSSVAACLP